MIPSDVASRLQISADAASRPVAQTQDIADKLAGLIAGQKVLAEIQTMLPNGTYRAMINQRSVTLALPFSAKSGDSLELQVTENDGKLAFAVLSGPDSQTAKTIPESASATLSRTGQLISNLFAGAQESRNSPAPATLNGNQPIADAPPTTAQDILPQLKQAITQSGMFYESHQAEWVEGRFPKAALLQEPQGKLSDPAAFASAHAGTSPAPSHEAALAARTTGNVVTQQAVTDTGQALNLGTESARPAPSAAAQNQGQVVAPQTQPLVQQQLEALATQNFSWQGQVWPGQDMQWEIDADASRRGDTDDETATQWSTRLRLTLPNLGEIDARIRLNGKQIALSINADSPETRTLLRVSGLDLSQQLDEAGLVLASLGVGSVEKDTATGAGDGQAGE